MLPGSLCGPLASGPEVTAVHRCLLEVANCDVFRRIGKVKWRKREARLLSRGFTPSEKERTHGRSWRSVGGIPFSAASTEPGIL